MINDREKTMQEIYNVLKKYLYSTLTGETPLTASDIVAVFVVTLALGLYIFLIYRHQTKSAFYSKDFNMTLPGLSVVTAGIMVAMQANLLVSLGMVGSLSIVRFRTAVKSPIDLLYLFWAISIGIISGVGLYGLAVLVCCCVTCVLIGLKCLDSVSLTNLVIVTATPKADIEKVKDAIKKFSKKSKQASIILKNEQSEYVYEVRSSDLEKMANAISEIKGIVSVNVVSNIADKRF